MVKKETLSLKTLETNQVEAESKSSQSTAINPNREKIPQQIDVDQHRHSRLVGRLIDISWGGVKRGLQYLSVVDDDKLMGLWSWPLISLTLGLGVGYWWYLDSSNLGAFISGLWMTYGGFISGVANDPLRAFLEHFGATALIIFLFWALGFNMTTVTLACLISLLISGVVTLRVMAEND